MDLNEKAAAMKAAAEKCGLITRQQMLDRIVAFSFPDELKDNIVLNDVAYFLHYSHDELSDEKMLHHLSFARKDQLPPSDQDKDTLRKAFFDEEGVVEFPGNPVFGQHITHMAAVRLRT